MARPDLNKDDARKTALYRRFMTEVGIDTPTLQRLFAEEILHLSPEDFAVYKASDFFTPDTWTPEQVGVFRNMIGRRSPR